MTGVQTCALPIWLSINPNITWEIVQANPDKQWDWCDLSKIIKISLNPTLKDFCRESILKGQIHVDEKVPIEMIKFVSCKLN